MINKDKKRGRMHSNKEGCYIYIKEVKSGEVFVTLSEEERQSLEQAMTAE